VTEQGVSGLIFLLTFSGEYDIILIDMLNKFVNKGVHRIDVNLRIQAFCGRRFLFRLGEEVGYGWYEK